MLVVELFGELSGVKKCLKSHFLQLYNKIFKSDSGILPSDNLQTSSENILLEFLRNRSKIQPQKNIELRADFQALETKPLTPLSTRSKSNSWVFHLLHFVLHIFCFKPEFICTTNSENNPQKNCFGLLEVPESFNYLASSTKFPVKYCSSLWKELKESDTTWYLEIISG